MKVVVLMWLITLIIILSIYEKEENIEEVKIKQVVIKKTYQRKITRTTKLYDGDTVGIELDTIYTLIK